MMEDWRNGRVVPGYSVASPTYDRATRTLGSVQAPNDAAGCGTVKEWKWNGWFFHLTHVAGKNACDDVPPDDDTYAWQTDPAQR
jgi:hypothetical protein